MSCCPRSRSIATVYIGLLLILAGTVAIVVPPIVEQGIELVENAPEYADDAEKFIQDNEQLRELDEKYDVTGELQKQADALPDGIGDATSVLRDITLGLSDSIFALVNIMVLSSSCLRQVAAGSTG